jgi:hypothetical protein
MKPMAARPQKIAFEMGYRGDTAWTGPEAPRLARNRGGSEVVPIHEFCHGAAACPFAALRVGVDVNTIRARLGRASLVITNVYAEVDLEMKAKALETCQIK